MNGCGIQNNLDALLESGRSRQLVIHHMPVGVVARAVGRLAAKLFTLKGVPDATFLEGFRQEFPIEVRQVAAVGRRTHVHHGVHAVRAQQRQKRLRFVV